MTETLSRRQGAPPPATLHIELLIDPSGTVVWANGAAGDLWYTESSALRERPAADLFAPRSRQRLRHLIDRVIGRTRRRPPRAPVELWALTDDDREVALAVRAARDADTTQHVRLTGIDITARVRREGRVRREADGLSEQLRERSRELEQANAHLQLEIDQHRRTEAELRRAKRALEKANLRLRHLALVDDLTGLANRRQADSRLSSETARAGRDGTPLAMLMIDIDWFKAFNDTLGHPAGDDCLRRTAQAIAESARRPGDLCARWGGEEFAAVLPRTDLRGAREVAKRILRRVRALALPHPGSPMGRLTVSVGAASLIPERGSTRPDDLVALADRALYRAKANGRNTVVCSDDAGRGDAAPT